MKYDTSRPGYKEEIIKVSGGIRWEKNEIVNLGN